MNSSAASNRPAASSSRAWVTGLGRVPRLLGRRTPLIVGVTGLLGGVTGLLGGVTGLLGGRTPLIGGAGAPMASDPGLASSAGRPGTDPGPRPAGFDVRHGQIDPR